MLYTKNKIRLLKIAGNEFGHNISILTYTVTFVGINIPVKFDQFWYISSMFLGLYFFAIDHVGVVLCNYYAFLDFSARMLCSFFWRTLTHVAKSTFSHQSISDSNGLDSPAGMTDDLRFSLYLAPLFIVGCCKMSLTHFRLERNISASHPRLAIWLAEP